MHENNTDESIYQIMIVEKCTAPEGMAGDDWHRYVIGRGRSKIEGKKTGTLKEVIEHAENMAVLINERNGKKGANYAQRYVPPKKS